MYVGIFPAPKAYTSFPERQNINTNKSTIKVKELVLRDMMDGQVRKRSTLVLGVKGNIPSVGNNDVNLTSIYGNIPEAFA